MARSAVRTSALGEGNRSFTQTLTTRKELTMTQSSPRQNDPFNLRPATPADVPQILRFIHDLAEYEREPDAVHATEDDLLRDGFGKTKRFDCLIAELNQSG